MDAKFVIHDAFYRLTLAACPLRATYFEEMELLRFTDKIQGCNYACGTFLATIRCAKSPLKMLKAQVDQYE